MSNNFTSGMAGPAAVELLNTLWDRVTEQIVGNSTTSLTIGTGAKTLTIEASKQFAIGQTARITYNSDINKWMQGTVSAYNASTGSLSITVDTISGSGTYALWTVALTGSVGPTVFSGTYTPSLAPVTNIGSSAAVACQYMRVGNVVSVSGHVYLGPAATGPALIGVTLPIPSNFTIPSQLGGTFAASGVDENPGSIYADTANDLAIFDIQAKQTAVAAYTFHFTYVVL